MTALLAVGTAVLGADAAVAERQAATGPGAAAVPPAGTPSGVADDRLLVGVEPGTTDAQAEAVASEAGAPAPERFGDTLVVDPPAGRVRATSAELRQDARVQYVEPNYRLRASAATPNDPLFGFQYALGDAQPGGIQAESAWSTTTGSSDVVIGVLDSGIDLDHPDLVANLWTNRTGINGCGYGTRGVDVQNNDCVPDDDAGHGTHVAGIAGARGGNGIGIAGTSQRSSLMALKMLDANGYGSVADAVEAIDWALAAKSAGVNLRVLVASWGGADYSQQLANAIARAKDAGVLFVTAAGNDGNDIAQNPVYPCAFPLDNIVCVAASTEMDDLAGFSDGTDSNYGTAVDLAAPGTSIVSTVPPEMVFYDEFGDPVCDRVAYCAFEGTSMAAPYVAGGAALVLAAEPNLTVSALKARILASVDALVELDGLVATGGRFNLCKAVAGCGTIGQTVPTVPNQVNVLARDGAVTVSWQPPDSNGNGFTVTGYRVSGPTGTVDVGLSTFSYTFTGLTNNTNGTFTVRALNNIGQSSAVSKVARPHGGGYEVDGFGGLQIVGYQGKAPTAATVSGYWTGLDIARGAAMLPDGTGGYVVDAYGGLHRFSVGGNPLPPVATGGPYWLGRDLARGVVLLPNGSGGYVLDAYGGLQPFGIGDEARPPVPTVSGYWSGWDIARDAAVTDDSGGGYVVDAYGGLHRFRIGASPFPPVATGGPYWLGWDIVRGVSLVPGSGGGWVLDGYGGLHSFRTTGAAPGPPSKNPYWYGWDIARGVSL